MTRLTNQERQGLDDLFSCLCSKPTPFYLRVFYKLRSFFLSPYM
ncbi:hypothetical protein [Sulfurospirillum tamanense]|nr:hypothetical protein [Sulfurospirillum tamanensis]